MIFRAATAADMARLEPLVVPDPASGMTFTGYREVADNGEYRDEWTWIAEADGTGPVFAAGIWWGSPGDRSPQTLHGLFADGMLDRHQRPSVAGALIRAAHAAFTTAGGPVPNFALTVPGDWRGRRDVVAAMSWRWEAALSAGLTAELERLRYVWTSDWGLPQATGRLTFLAEPDDEVFATLFRKVLEGSLDATSRRAAEALGAALQARHDVAFYRDRTLGDRSWWRVAMRADGEVVGFGVPSLHAEGPVVGYLGVLPRHRGRGYARDIVAEITRILVEAGARTVYADTDLANRPMAAAFERAGYKNFARQLALSAS